MSGFHHSGMSGFDASMVYDDDEILTLVKGLEACESTQEAYKYIKKIKDENKTLKDENKALKAALPQSAHKCEKCGRCVEVVEKYVEGISDENGELWWCIDCYDYHQEHGW